MKTKTSTLLLTALAAAFQAASLAGAATDPDRSVDQQLFGGTPLEIRTVQACDLSVTAGWRGSFPDYKRDSDSERCVYNPPPGWVLLDYSIVRKSDNNGSYKVDVLAAGLDLMSVEEVRRAYDSMTHKQANFGQYGGQRKLEERANEHERMVLQYQTNKNTLIAKVKAKGHGDKFDRKRGWMKLRGQARILFLGTGGTEPQS